MAVAAVRDDLAEHHYALVGAIVDLGTEDEHDPIAAWQDRNIDAIERFSRIISDLRRESLVDIARACTASAELKLLASTTRLLSCYQGIADSPLHSDRELTV